MFDLLLNAITSLGIDGASSALISAGENAIKKNNNFQSWKKVIVGTGEFFKNFEKEENSFFEDLKLVLSKENMSQIAKDLHPDDGYLLKQKLYKTFMQLMQSCFLVLFSPMPQGHI